MKYFALNDWQERHGKRKDKNHKHPIIILKDADTQCKEEEEKKHAEKSILMYLTLRVVYNNNKINFKKRSRVDVYLIQSVLLSSSLPFFYFTHFTMLLLD